MSRTLAAAVGGAASQPVRPHSALGWGSGVGLAEIASRTGKGSFLKTIDASRSSTARGSAQFRTVSGRVPVAPSVALFWANRCP